MRGSERRGRRSRRESHGERENEKNRKGKAPPSSTPGAGLPATSGVRVVGVRTSEAAAGPRLLAKSAMDDPPILQFCFYF